MRQTGKVGDLESEGGFCFGSGPGFVIARAHIDRAGGGRER